jgi:hypothetical protein
MVIIIKDANVLKVIKKNKDSIFAIIIVLFMFFGILMMIENKPSTPASNMTRFFQGLKQ